MSPSSRWLLCLSVLWTLALPAWAEVKWVTFRCEPTDAKVFLEIGSDSPYQLGVSNQKIPLDLALFDGRRDIRLSFRREGYLTESRVLQQSPVQLRYFDSRDSYPSADEGPVRLTPRSDLKSRSVQLKLWLAGHRWQTLSLLVLATLMLAFGWTKYRGLASKAARGETLDNLVVDLEDDPFSGKTLGKYRLLDRLGTGGMSMVYRARPDDALESEQQEVAVKVMDPKLAGEAGSTKRFRREIQICTKLQHPNILQLYDYGEQDSALYLVMELLRGQTLAQKISGRRLRAEELQSYVEPVVEALAYLHSQNIVHRDLKPDNIFLTDEGRVKLMDFGISRGEAFTVATATHQGLGTPAYMSPEQVEGRFEEASDQYSLGCVVYEWLVGEPPFTDPDPFALAFKHVGQHAAPLRSRRPSLSEELEIVVSRMLSKQPEDRYPSIKDAGEALLTSLRNLGDSKGS
jgi:Protein kinase domain